MKDWDEGSEFDFPAHKCYKCNEFRSKDLGVTLHDLFKLSPLPSSSSSWLLLLLLYLGMQTRSLLITMTLLHRVLPSLRAGIAVLASTPLSHALLTKRPFMLSITAVIRLLDVTMPMSKRPFLLTPKRRLDLAFLPVRVPRAVGDRPHTTTTPLPTPLHPPVLSTISHITVTATILRETATIALVTATRLLWSDGARHGGRRWQLTASALRHFVSEARHDALCAGLHDCPADLQYRI